MAISSLQYGEIIRNIYDSTVNGIKTWSGGKTFRVTAEVTRPADTTAYASGDSISSSTSAPAIIVLSSVCEAGGNFLVTNFGILTDEVYTSAQTIRIHVYNTEVTPGNDNAANTTTYASETGFIGSADVAFYGNTGGDGSKGFNLSDRITGSTATGNLWVKLEARSAIATASGQKIKVTLAGEAL